MQPRAHAHSHRYYVVAYVLRQEVRRAQARVAMSKVNRIAENAIALAKLAEGADAARHAEETVRRTADTSRENPGETELDQCYLGRLWNSFRYPNLNIVDYQSSARWSTRQRAAHIVYQGAAGRMDWSVYVGVATDTYAILTIIPGRALTWQWHVEAAYVLSVMLYVHIGPLRSHGRECGFAGSLHRTKEVHLTQSRDLLHRGSLNGR